MHLEVFRIVSKWKLSFKVKPGFPILSNTKALHTKILYLALFINFNMDHVMSPVMEEISDTMVAQMVQNSIFIFTGIFIFKDIFIFSDIVIFREIFIFSEIVIFRDISGTHLRFSGGSGPNFRKGVNQYKINKKRI